MFEVKNLSITLVDKIMIQNLSFTLNKGDKLAIIGEEGDGKSTLLKVLLGICDYAIISGTISYNGNRIGYLEQSMREADLEKTGFVYLFTEEEKYYEKITEFYKYLELLHLKEIILKQKLSTFSGGEKVKIGILKLLLESVDIFFLDEPTNDLDLETLEWLEDFINHIDKPVLYVSHDETLLSNTANRILHLEQIKHKTECKYTLLNTDYDTYVETRLRGLEKQSQLAKSEKRDYQKSQERLRRVMNKVEYKQNTISRQNPHGAKVLKKKMHALKSQERKLEAKDLMEPPSVEENITLFFGSVEIPKTKRILNLDMAMLLVGNQLLSRNIHLEVVGNVHVCIIGKNGAGKTTLLKEIYEKLKTREDIRVGYMPQDYNAILKNYGTVLDYLSDTDKTKARMYLGNLNFTREEMTGKIDSLSNGSKAKLILLKMVLINCNVLLLDEPTRNISPLSSPVIRKALREFKGTIISISHDRKYMEEVCDTLYELTLDGLIKKR